MPVSLSKTEICSFVGDVLPLYLADGERDLSGAAITWAVTGECATVRAFCKDPLSPFTHGVLVALCKVGEGIYTGFPEAKISFAISQ